MRTGFYIVGKLLGFKSDSFTNRETGEIRTRNTLGIQLQEPDGYGGYNTLTQQLKVDDECLNQAFNATIDRLRGKQVMILVYPREWAMEGGRKGITYNFDSTSSIEEVKE